MTELEQKQAEEIASLRAKLAEAERERNRYHDYYHASERDKTTLESIFVKLLARLIGSQL